MVSAKGLVTVLFLIQTVFGVKWYANYDLSEDHIENLKNQGCYRGLYGGGLNITRTLSLVTCASDGTEPFAITDDDAFLCVVELTHNVSIEAAEAVANRLGAKVLFRGRQELVLGNPSLPSELHEACFRDNFPAIADNVRYVPRDSMVPVSPYPEDHPILQRFGPGKVAAPNPAITAIINKLSQSNIQNTDVYLSTDNSGATGTGSKITRNSYAVNSRCAAGWKCPHDTITYLQNQINNWFKSYTPAIKVERRAFRTDMCDNLIVTIPGVTAPQKINVVGAHLDSRMALLSSTDAPAPGADDNGSGSSVLLEYARVIGENNYKFVNTIQLQWFCGEEQGLLGSNALAKQYRAEGVDVVAMFNIDMIGWVWQPTSGTTRSVMSFMTGSANAALSQVCKEASQLYNPAQEVGDTKACCSDQESYHTYGYRAAGIFETPTNGVQYPYYHRETDVYTAVSFPQVFSFAKSFLACVLEHAVPVSS
jgi:hypothetical protein